MKDNPVLKLQEFVGSLGKINQIVSEVLDLSDKKYKEYEIVKKKIEDLEASALKINSDLNNKKSGIENFISEESYKISELKQKYNQLIEVENRKIEDIKQTETQLKSAEINLNSKIKEVDKLKKEYQDKIDKINMVLK